MRVTNLVILLSFILFSCEDNKNLNHLKPGTWRGEILLSNKVWMPFIFDVSASNNDTIIHLINGDEKILLDEIDYYGDSIYIPLHIFDASLTAAFKDDGSLSGIFERHYKDNYKLPFKALHGNEERFGKVKEDPEKFIGKWDVNFIEPPANDTTKAIGEFYMESDSSLTGTFLFATGDYRYLEGGVYQDTMKLSTFDGNHAFLFTAVIQKDSSMIGKFWSGKEWFENWYAKKDPDASLPDPESLTYLKPGYETIDFGFPNLEGDIISPEDYRGNVLILQLFGSWCPNCMDETKFLTKWAQETKNDNVKVLGLAYESKDDYEYARTRIMKMKEKLNPPYEFVIAGTSDKAEASKTLPMLNEIISFPTLIFLDTEGKVRKIHTGFTGPGTGEKYEEFKSEFRTTVNDLLKELE